MKKVHVKRETHSKPMYNREANVLQLKGKSIENVRKGRPGVVCAQVCGPL